MAIQFTFDEAKTTQAAALIIQLHGEKNTISRLSLIKLLYFVDREALGKWLRPITGDVYYCMQHGPILSEVLNLLGYEEEGTGNLWQDYIEAVSSNQAVLKTSPDFDRLSKNEIALIENVCRDHHGWTPAALRDKSHGLPEYISTEAHARNELPVKRILRHLKYDEAQIDDLETELRERKAYTLLLD